MTGRGTRDRRTDSLRLRPTPRLHLAIILALVAATACAPAVPAALAPVPYPPPCASPLPGLDRPYTTVEQVLIHLETLERILRDEGDLRAVFTSVYLLTTRAVHGALTSHRFEDELWAASLTIAFADLYRQALFDDECGRRERVPGAWRLAFDTARSGRATALQAAVLGVNAHINHDLALALLRTASAHREDRSRDDELLDALIVGEIDAVQERLARRYDPALARFDRDLGRLDEDWVGQVVRSWRAGAWAMAIELGGGRDPGAVLWTLEVGSTVRGLLLAGLFRAEDAPAAARDER